jgi:hypothetical protein
VNLIAHFFLSPRLKTSGAIPLLPLYALMDWTGKIYSRITVVKNQILSKRLNCKTDNHHHHHHISVMELGHLLTRFFLTCPEVSSKVCRDSFCQLGNSVSLPWVIYYEAFYLHVVSSFSFIPVIGLKLMLFLIPLQFCVFVL